MAHGSGHVGIEHSGHRKGDRKWLREITKIDGKPLGVRRIFCATSGCGQQGELLDRTNDGFPPSLIERKFEQKGWEIGKSDKHDYCPACVERQKIERRARRNGTGTKAVNLSLVPTQPVSQKETLSMPTPTAPATTTDTIAVATREDNRTIFAKLQDVYLDESKGYMAPWTDQAVAKDLGCPLAWVQKIREDNFRPTRDNSEIRDMLDRVELNARDAQSILDEAKWLKGEVASLVAQNNALNARIEAVSRNLGGLLATADRIGKAVLT